MKTRHELSCIIFKLWIKIIWNFCLIKLTSIFNTKFEVKIFALISFPSILNIGSSIWIKKNSRKKLLYFTLIPLKVKVFRSRHFYVHFTAIYICYFLEARKNATHPHQSFSLKSPCSAMGAAFDPTTSKNQTRPERFFSQKFTNTIVRCSGIIQCQTLSLMLVFPFYC